MRCKTGPDEQLTVVLSALVVFSAIVFVLRRFSGSVVAEQTVSRSGEDDSCTGNEEDYQNRGDDREL